MLFDVQYPGLTQLTVRLQGTGNRVTDALEAEMRRQMPLMSQAVKENIATRFRNPQRMQSAVSPGEVQRQGDVITGEVDASGRRTGVNVPFMSIQESGGVTSPHPIVARVARELAFFWENEGIWFFGRRVNHPGSKIPAHNFVRDAFDERKGPMLDAFRRVIGAAVV